MQNFLDESERLFEERSNYENFTRVEQDFRSLKGNHLFDPHEYPESLYELDRDKVKSFLRERQKALIERVVEEIEKMRENKPHICSPESDAYMYSLAQFNRVAGKNKTIDDIKSLLTNLE